MNASQKFNFQESLGRIGQNSAIDAIKLMGKALPASVVSMSGAIATIKFEVSDDYNLPQIDVPVAGSEYVRIPLKAGDKGVVFPCDANIYGVSGQAEITADLSAPGNLSALVFFPIGNKKWKSVDPKMLTLTGLSDVMIRDDSHQLQLEDENTAWVNLISQINALLPLIISGIAAASGTSTGLPPITLTNILTTTNPVKTRV